MQKQSAKYPASVSEMLSQPGGAWGDVTTKCNVAFLMGSRKQKGRRMSTQEIWIMCVNDKVSILGSLIVTNVHCFLCNVSVNLKVFYRKKISLKKILNTFMWYLPYSATGKHSEQSIAHQRPVGVRGRQQPFNQSTVISCQAPVISAFTVTLLRVCCGPNICTPCLQILCWAEGGWVCSGCHDNRHLFFTALKVGSSRSRCQRGRFPSKTSFLVGSFHLVRSHDLSFVHTQNTVDT